MQATVVGAEQEGRQLCELSALPGAFLGAEGRSDGSVAGGRRCAAGGYGAASGARCGRFRCGCESRECDASAERSDAFAVAHATGSDGGASRCGSAGGASVKFRCRAAGRGGGRRHTRRRSRAPGCRSCFATGVPGQHDGVTISAT